MIERIFHQIWINSSNPDLPDRFKQFRDTWLARHPDWEYRLWNLENLEFDPSCAALLPKCQHAAQMADLLRMEIIYRYGGVYVDTDFECLRPIDKILEGIEAFGCSEDGRCITNSILGARKHSRLFKSVIDSFPASLGNKPVNIETGPAFLTDVILRTGFKNDFTLFPTYFFYPFNYHTRDRTSVDLSRSYAMHHYADSWKPPVPLWKKCLGKVRRSLSTLRVS